MEFKRELKIIFKLISAVVSLILIVYYFYYFIVRADILVVMQSDFASFFTGAKIVTDNVGSGLYDLSVQSKWQKEIIGGFIDPSMLLPYINLPFFAYFLTPLVSFGFINGYRIFNIFIILNFVFFAYLLQTRFPEIKNYSLWPLMFVFYYPNFQSLQMSQVSLFIASVFVLMYSMIKRKKFTGAGMLTGLLLVKPQYLVVLPFLLSIVDKRCDFLKGLLITTGVLILISIFVSGYNFPASYLKFLFQTNSPEFGNRPWNMYSLYSFVEVYLKNFNLAIVVNLTVYLITIFIMHKEKDRSRLNIYFSAMLIFAITFSMHTLVHDLSILSIAIVILLLEMNKIKVFFHKFVFYAVIFLLFFSPLMSLRGSVGITPLLIFFCGLILILYNRVKSTKFFSFLKI